MGEGTAPLGSDDGTAARGTLVATDKTRLPAEAVPPAPVPAVRRPVDNEDAASRVRVLSRESRETRRHLDALISELDRRSREALDWRRQARLHARGLLITAAGVTAFAVAVGVSIARRRRRRTFAERAAERAGEFADRVGRLGRGLRRVARNPDRLAAEDGASRSKSATPAAVSSLVITAAQVALPYIADALWSRRR